MQSAHLSHEPVHVGEFLIIRLLRCSLVPRKVATSAPGVGKLLPLVFVVVIATREDNGVGPLVLSPVDTRHVGSVYPRLTHLGVTRSEFNSRDSEREELSHLNSELPHGTDRYPRNGSEVVGGDNGALLGSPDTRHPLQSRRRQLRWRYQ